MAKKQGYGANAVYGSLAYDFDNPELYGGFTMDGAAEAPAAVPGSKQAVETEAEVVSAPGQAIAPGAIVGFMCVAVLLIFTLLAQVKLTAVTNEMVSMYDQIDELELKQSRLRIAYESAFNLSEIEDYATHRLGMQRPRSDQIYYINGSAPDKAEILHANEESDTLEFRMTDLFDSIVEYFR